MGTHLLNQVIYICDSFVKENLWAITVIFVHLLFFFQTIMILFLFDDVSGLTMSLLSNFWDSWKIIVRVWVLNNRGFLLNEILFYKTITDIWNGRYISYISMFIPQFCRYVHLISNLFFQLVLGMPLEIVHKWWRLLIVYSAGVVGGSLAHSVTDFNVNLVGASGGCYAILGAHLAAVIVVSFFLWKWTWYRHKFMVK